MAEKNAQSESHLVPVGPLAPGQRWSLARKREVALRLLRGEPLDALSRELGVEVYRLERWKDKALAGLDAGLKEREGDPLQSQLDAAMRRIGELSMENELLCARIERPGPLGGRRSKRRRAARRRACRWPWRPRRSALRPPAAQRAGALDPCAEQLVLHGELADAAHGGVERLAAQEPQRHLTLAGKAPALPRSEWSHGGEVTL